MFVPTIGQHVVCQVEPGRTVPCRVIAVSPVNMRAKVFVMSGAGARLERWVSIAASKMRRMI